LPAEERELGAEFVEDGGEASDGGAVGVAYGRLGPVGADDEVDGAVVKVEAAAVGKELSLKTRALSPRERVG
jgi:hypothetical protein